MAIVEMDLRNPDGMENLDTFVEEFAREHVPEDLADYVPPELPEDLTDEQREAIYDLEDAIWETRFDPNRIADLADHYLEEGTDQNLRPLIGDRQFVVAYLPAAGPHGDVGLKAEAEVFASVFDQRLAEAVRDYNGPDNKYVEGSTFATVIDVATPRPVAAGVARIVDYVPVAGFKDVNDLTVDDPETNPWINEIKARYFEPGEVYSPEEAWDRMTAANNGGEPIKLEESVDVATHASADAYRGAHGSMNGVSMLFFHAIVRHMQAKQKDNILAIFDVKPLANLQQFGEPFNTYDGLNPHPYGGPGDTVPAFTPLKQAIERIRAFDQGSADVFERGLGLDILAFMPNEYLPEEYSDNAVGLVS